jgi:hypothetical protein
MERIHWLESSMADLQQRHEAFADEMKTDLVLKYQRLLVNEQKRFDGLMEKYTRLVKTGQPQKAIEPEEERKNVVDRAAGRTSGEGKFTQLFKMVESQKALEKEKKKP